LAGPGSGNEQILGANKCVRLLQNAIAGFSPGDEAARMDLYARARAFLISRLSERNGLSQSEIEAEVRVFDEASRQVEEEARSLASAQVAAESQLTSAYSGPISSAARSDEITTSDKPEPASVLSDHVAGENPDAEPRVQLQPASEALRAPLKISAPEPLRSASGARDPKLRSPPRGPNRLHRTKTRGEGLARIYARARKLLIDRWGGRGDLTKGRRGRPLEEVSSRLERGARSSAVAKASAERPSMASAPPVSPLSGENAQSGTLKAHLKSSDHSLGSHAGPHPQVRLQAVIQVARHHAVDLDLNELRVADSELPSAAALSAWAQNSGLWSRAVRTTWRQLLRMSSAGPVILLFNDGSAGLMVGVNAEQQVVLLKDPSASPDSQPVPVDELRLSQVWNGEAILVRASRGRVAADAPFNLRWLLDLVLQERRSLRDIGIASLTISFLTIFPPLLVMTMVNKVLQFHSVSTLILLTAVMAVVVIYETLLGHARRLIIAVVGARLDARLNLHVFNRLLRLPLDYFERHPAGETMFRIAQVYKVREFLTGRLVSTLLDMITLCVLLPFLFYLSPMLASIVLACAVVIMLIILAFLKPMREMFSRVMTAETWKSATLGETIVGIKTVKALALEPQRRAIWDERIAEAGKWRLAFSRLSNWPQTLVTPIERIMVLGTTMLGAYLAMNDPTGYMVGGLFAFLMLAGRAAQPLVGLARLTEEYEEIAAAIGEAGSVLNRPAETNARSAGLRPKFAGEINFQDVTFTYLNTTVPALDGVSFTVPAGSTLGIVGRSGSGKSTVTRLLQGINRDYKGFVKIDGADLRDVDLRHLRQSLGVVLQENFLFRGSIRDNIIAGRPGLTLSDAVYAARLAGAEEFIERMPNGFETYIEEGSPNLSGGQRQRLAIARALITDPRILVLDEATSALDPESEAVVSANLERIANGRTMVLVSHRLSSLVGCDQILVMDQGHIVDCGKHEVLVERCPIYRQLWKQQNRHLETPRPSAAPRLFSSGTTQP
jgi:subfamily B ATP-binding cassette protein HlyB/CyaB